MASLNDYRNVFDFADLEKVELSPEEFWPVKGSTPDKDGHTEYFDAMLDYHKKMDPWVKALETTAFAIPEAGVAVSAGIGLLWKAVEPGAIKTYQEPMKDMLGKIVGDKLKDSKLQSARSSLDQFNTYMSQAAKYAVPETEHDIEHSKTCEDYVKPGGLLVNAFYDIKDNLPWFNASVHQLLISAMTSIWSAYVLRIKCLYGIGQRARSENDVAAYNKAQFEVITILSSVSSSTGALYNAANDKIEILKKQRSDEIAANGTTKGCNNIVDHRWHPEIQKDYFVEKWVDDKESKRRILLAKLKQTTFAESVEDGLRSVGDLLSAFTPKTRILTLDPVQHAPSNRADGSMDDAHLENIMRVAIEQYRTRLLPKPMEKHWEQLLSGMQKVVNQAKTLELMRLPQEIKISPGLVKPEKYVKAPESALAGLNVGNQMWFWYTIHESKDAPKVLARSPRSSAIIYEKASELKQLYVGDGNAAMNTSRRIYRSTSKDDNVGTLVDIITGHCIMLWPQEVVKART